VPVVTPVKRGTRPEDVPDGLLPEEEDEEEPLGSLLSEALDAPEVSVESFFLVPKLSQVISSGQGEDTISLTGLPTQLREQSPQARLQAEATKGATAASSCHRLDLQPTLAYHPNRNRFQPIVAFHRAHLPCLDSGSNPVRQQQRQRRQSRVRDLMLRWFGLHDVGFLDSLEGRKRDREMQ
jgi:hypothetical protein